MLVYELLSIASRCILIYCFLYVVLSIGMVVVKFFKGERDNNSAWFRKIKKDVQANPLRRKRWVIVLIFTLVAYFATSAATLDVVGIHDLRLKPEGQYCFFVEAQRENGKTYTLPAQVRVNTFDGRDYYVEKVFFSNGGWLEFHNEDYIDIGESAYFYENDEEWRVKLLNEHAYSPHVTETNNAEGGDIIQMLAETIPVLFLLCACVIPLKETEEE